MEGRKVLVVGASSGIGAAFARAAGHAGAQVTVVARRGRLLDELLADIRWGHRVVADVGDPAEARRIADTAAASMGGIDLLLFAAGRGRLQRLEQTDPDTWVDLYRVNVVAPNLVTAAVQPHMHTDGVCAYLSSRTVQDANAFFAPYSASKAALDHCIRTWRIEHPERRFVRIVMGNCQPTGFADHMGDDDLLTEALLAWGRQGLPGGLMHVDAVGRALVDHSASRSTIPRSTVQKSSLMRVPSEPVSRRYRLAAFEWLTHEFRGGPLRTTYSSDRVMQRVGTRA